MGIRCTVSRRAVFLDRDGVLNAAIVRDGKSFPPPSVAEVRILDGVPEAVNLLKEAGMLLVVISNQPDVARGTQRRETVQAINDWLGVRLPLDRFEVCYHDDTDRCDCRKPKPGMIFRSAKALGIDLEDSFVVGDRWRDIDAGKAAGCRCVWIDYGYAERKSISHDYRAISLLDASTWIIKQLERRKG